MNHVRKRTELDYRDSFNHKQLFRKLRAHLTILTITVWKKNNHLALQSKHIHIHARIQLAVDQHARSFSARQFSSHSSQAWGIAWSCCDLSAVPALCFVNFIHFDSAQHSSMPDPSVDPFYPQTDQHSYPMCCHLQTYRG